MSQFVVDVESDGQLPGIHNMISFGIVKVEPSLEKTFLGEVCPITGNRVEEAARVSGVERLDHIHYPHPEVIMKEAAQWVQLNNTHGRPILWSDNNGYDAAFMNFYFLHFTGENPFGWSSRRIGDVFAGLKKNARYRWKKHRKGKYDHNPVNDAKANAAAMLYAVDELDFDLDLR
jgi:hypothetical protein